MYLNLIFVTKSRYIKCNSPHGPINLLYENTLHILVGFKDFDMAVAAVVPFGGQRIVDSVSQTHDSGTTEHQSSPRTTYQTLKNNNFTEQ